MFFSILGAIAEFEASLLSERTKDGLEAAPMLDRPETRSHLQVRSCVRMGDMQHKPDQVIAEIADRIRQVVEADQRVRFAYLFGSMSRGDDRPESDVDLAVLTRPRGTLLDDARLHDELAAALGRDDVDLLVLDEAPLWLQYRVLAGHVVFSRDEPERIAFRQRVEKEFLDFRPYHDSYLRAVRERARRGALSRG